MLPRPLATVIVALTTLVWMANFFAPFVMPDYKPDPAINGIYVAIIGGALALSRGGGGGGDGKNGDTPSRSGGLGEAFKGAIAGFTGQNNPPSAPAPQPPEPPASPGTPTNNGPGGGGGL